MITFEEAIQENQRLCISPGCKTQNTGYFTNERVDRSTVPTGWYAYDIRHGDSGNFTALENGVKVNHFSHKQTLFNIYTKSIKILLILFVHLYLFPAIFKVFVK